ncbi:MAG: AAA family ATPase [Cyanobacteria bacterium P01_G01_bin.54]
MRISKILIKGFQQFQNFYLDLEHPETGEAPEKVCFIGPNGTGKSTLLRLIRNALYNTTHTKGTLSIFNPQILALKITNRDTDCWQFSFPRNTKTLAKDDVSMARLYCQKELDEDIKAWPELIFSSTQREVLLGRLNEYRLDGRPFSAIESGSNDLIIEFPADRSLELENDPPRATLDEAFQYFRNFSVHHFVSTENSEDFWKVLTYQTATRKDKYISYLTSPENRVKTVEQAECDFDQEYPSILPGIEEIWNRVLNKVGLCFDSGDFKIPNQVNDVLATNIYIGSNSLDTLKFNDLSSGIRNYIFKLGHLYALYFQRDVKRGFLLIDEPENSLYPDLLYELINEYYSITQNTQMFVATHSPIIAAQFEPHQRIHLDFDENGYVTATRGTAPIGDDPNDLLIKDFRVRSIYGKEGLEKWERFLELKRLIQKEEDKDKRSQLIREYLSIGNAYDFDPDYYLNSNAVS